jgi:hypothetical protein
MACSRAVTNAQFRQYLAVHHFTVLNQDEVKKKLEEFQACQVHHMKILPAVC